MTAHSQSSPEDSSVLEEKSPSSSRFSKRTQWDLLERYINTLSPGSDPTPPSWLRWLDKPILLTFTSKARGQLRFLYSEATQRTTTLDKPPHNHQFLNYDVGNHDTSHPSPSPQERTNSTTEAKDHPTLAEPTIDASVESRGAFRPHPPRIYSRGNSDNRLLLPELQSSPLSPAFGPRRGHPFSGTTQRRRSSPSTLPSPPNSFLAIPPAPTVPVTERLAWAPDLRPGSCLADASWSRCTVLERKLIWEAAWVEIERNLEEWVERFGVGNELVKEREDLWVELIGVTLEKMQIEEAF